MRKSNRESGAVRDPRRHAIELASRRWRLRCVFGSWGDAPPRQLIHAPELTFGTGASTATRTPGGQAGTAASGRRPEGLRCSGGVTVPARTRAGGTSTVIFWAAGAALVSGAGARATLVVLAVGVGVMTPRVLECARLVAAGRFAAASRWDRP